MTKKDFKVIAAAIRSLPRQQNLSRHGSKAIWESDLINTMADYLSSTNERFDRQRFIDACK